MLVEHFKLGVQPFGVTPDGRFLYLSPTHREALASLLHGIQARRGFTALIAPPGMGKTTVLLRLLSFVVANARTAFLFQTLCGPEQFLRSLLTELGIDAEGGDVGQMHEKLNAYLLQESNAGRQVIVVIDEAQNLDDTVLEMVRMLSNFETPGKKLMHLILCGQPQLAEKLASERLTQLRQRISIVARLTPFNADETREYIRHRLCVAGAAFENTIFSRQAYAMIAAKSGGIPRNINNLCFNAMSLACALKRSQVDAAMVRETVEDLNLANLVPAKHGSVFRRAPIPVLTIAIGLFVGSGLLAYNAMLLRERLTRLHTASGPLHETIHESETPALSKTIAPEDLNGQVVTSVMPPQIDVAPAAPSRKLPATFPIVHRREAARVIPRHKPTTDEKSAQAYGSQSAPGARDLILFPEDLERLQHIQNSEPSLKRQDPAKNDAAPKSDKVPADSTPQREKR